MTNITDKKKILVFLLLLGIITFFMLIITTLGKLLFNDLSSESNVWDGVTVASTINNNGNNEKNAHPISTAAEFMYFVENANDTKYYKLENDIYVNLGYFEYDGSKTYYYYNGKKYTVNGNSYYEGTTKKGNLNIIRKIENMNARLDGNGHKVSGIYINQPNENTSFIKTLYANGNIKNINFVNTYISGAGNVGFINSAENGIIENVSFSGNIINSGTVINHNDYSDGSLIQGKKIKLNFNERIFDKTSKSEAREITFDNSAVFDFYDVELYYLYSNIRNKSFSYYYIDDNKTTQDCGINEYYSKYQLNNRTYYSYNPTLPSISKTYFEEFQLEYYAYVKDDVTAFIIESKENAQIKNVSIGGNIYGKTLASGVIGMITGNVSLVNLNNNSSVYADKTGAGIIGYIKQNSTINANNFINSGNISSNGISGGIFGLIRSESVNINNVINLCTNLNSNQDAIFADITVVPNNTNNYYYRSGQSVKGVLRTDQLPQSFFSGIGFSTNDWSYLDSMIYLNNYDYQKPSVSITLPSISKTWDENYRNTSLNKIEMKDIDSFNVRINDNSDIAKIEYFVNNTNSVDVLDINAINYILSNLTLYDIKKSSYNSLYVKVTDAYGNVSYSYTDLVYLDCIDVSYSKGDSNITNTYLSNSIDTPINMEFTHTLESSSLPYATTSNFYLEFLQVLPAGTKIYFNDKVKNLIYTYEIKGTEFISNNNKFYLNFNVFESTMNKSNKYVNNILNYYHNNYFTNDFSFKFDFSNSNLTNNYDLNCKCVVLDSLHNKLVDTIGTKNFTIYKNGNFNGRLSLESSQSTIDLTSLNSSTNINYNFIKNYKNIDNNEVYDFLYENENLMKIQVVDNNDKPVNLINNFMIIYGVDNYKSNTSNYIILPMTNSRGYFNLSLFNVNNLGLTKDNYYLKVSIIDKNNYTEYASEKLNIFKLNKLECNNTYGFSVTTTNKLIYIKSKSSLIDGSNDIDIKFNYTDNIDNFYVKTSACKYNSEMTNCEQININSIFGTNGTVDGNNIKFNVNNNLHILKNINNNNIATGIYRIDFNVYNSNSTLITGDSIKLTVK